MKARGLLFLLLSRWVSHCHLQTDGIIRRFHLVDLNVSWVNAQSYCRTIFSDLATIQDPASNAEAQEVAGNGGVWIGLYNVSWRWSRGNEDVPKNNSFNSWAPAEPSPGGCVTISESGLWSVKNCGSKYSFVCYNAAANSHILVNGATMSWTDAQTYCRTKYTDLSSIRTNEDNVQISNLLQPVQPDPTGAGITPEIQSASTNANSVAPAPVAWIGLFRNVWGWSDQSGSPYRQWGKGQSGGDCVMMELSPSSADWLRKPCNENRSFLCYTAVSSSARTSVKVWLRGGSADMTNLALQDGVLQQLKQKLQDGVGREEVKLRWMMQPDGKVFHTDGEEKVPPE